MLNCPQTVVLFCELDGNDSGIEYLLFGISLASLLGLEKWK